MKICVTQSDIDHGRRKDCVKCPIALAICRTIPTSAWASVRMQNVIVRDSVQETCQSYYLSRSARRFVLRFDKGKYVEPFNFILTKMY